MRLPLFFCALFGKFVYLRKYYPGLFMTITNKFGLTIAVIISVTSCRQDDMPSLAIDRENASSFVRSPDEAMKVACEAFASNFGNADFSSRSSNLLDSASPVIIIPSEVQSRAKNVSDTCLYVVNFAEDSGFAIIAADRRVSPVLGISDCGHYDAENPDDNPGLEYFIGRAKEYVNSVNGPVQPLDYGFDERLQVKEWEDSVFTVNIPRRVNNSWNPGIVNTSTSLTLSSLSQNPTGYYFKNYYCGDAVIAIAHSLLYFSYPASINPTVHAEDASAKPTPYLSLNWDEIKQHRRYYTSNTVYGCSVNEINSCHEQIALLCRAIGNIGKCKETGTTTAPKVSMSLENISNTIMILGFHTKQWEAYTYTTVLSKSREIIIVTGWVDDISDTTHYWIIDGEKHFTAYHHYATRTNSSVPWNDTITNTYSQKLVHINWGRNGSGDGWYVKGVFSPRDSPDTKYFDPYYTVISLPDNV